MPDQKSTNEENLSKDAPLENSETEKERAPFDYYYDDGTGYEIYDSSTESDEESDEFSVDENASAKNTDKT